jgi:hypothetical protein
VSSRLVSLDTRSIGQTNVEVDCRQTADARQGKFRAASSLKRPSEAHWAVAQLHEVDAASAVFARSKNCVGVGPSKLVGLLFSSFPG